MNMFYKIWVDAQEETITFPLMFIGVKCQARQEWKKETIRNTSESQFNSEFECEFLGSIDTW